MNNFISTIKNHMSHDTDLSKYALLGLPGAMDRGNFTMIAIDKTFGPKYIIKVCRDNNQICKANKYCRQSYSELFLKDFEPIECK